MNKAQSKAIEKIRKLAETIHGHLADKYEIKKWQLEEFETFVSVIVVVGMKGDEGTMAEIFCRERAHLFIGKRGGITYPVSKEQRNGEWKHYEKRFEGYSLLQAVCDQK